MTHDSGFLDDQDQASLGIDTMLGFMVLDVDITLLVSLGIAFLSLWNCDFRNYSSLSRVMRIEINA